MGPLSLDKRRRRTLQSSPQPQDLNLSLVADFCHRKHGLTHRDLKPENLLLNEVPAWGPLKVLVLADFGMSKNEMDSVMVTWAGTKSYDGEHFLYCHHRNHLPNLPLPGSSCVSCKAL